MAPGFCRTFIAISSLASAQAVPAWDGTSLMQGVFVKDVHRRDTKSVSNLLETTGNMLKNGATSDVVEFVRATLDEITGIVMPAIVDASAVDQALLISMFAQFNVAVAALEEGNLEIQRLIEERHDHSELHKTCRDQEAERCLEKTTCDYELYELWETFVEEESELRSIETSIEQHFCEKDASGYYIANGTLATFRAISVPHMTSFTTQKPRVDIAEDNYGHAVPVCEHLFTVLDAKTEECDANQLTLERSVCVHAEAVRTVQTEFAVSWNEALISYNQTVAEVKILERDRCNECRSLAVIQCLLNRTSERNGRPCDESTDEEEVEFTHCEEVRITANCSWCELDYDPVPPPPPMPVMPWWPCEPQYINLEYGLLPAVPTPEFHNTNSHCNRRPDCQSCIDLEPEPDVTLCTSMSALTFYHLCEDLTVTAAPVTPAPPVSQHASCPSGWVQIGESGADIGGCGLQSCDQRYGTSSEAQCAAACDATGECEGFNFSPRNGDHNHESSTVCTLYNSNTPTGTWSGSAGYIQVFCTRAAEPPADTCGPLPELTHAVWNPSATGSLLQYHCEDGYSFDGFSFVEEFRDIECLPIGWSAQVRPCLPINDCAGHTCGAFGTCIDLHMDYTCECLDGIEMHVVNDEKVCGNEDDCPGAQCGSGGTCEDLVQEYNCVCHEGWEQVVGQNEIQSCERIECGNIPQIDNLMAMTGDDAFIGGEGIFPWTRGKAVFQDIVEYNCGHGYSTNGLIDGPMVFTISCQATGEFTEAQQCLPISCGEPQPSGGATPISDDLVLFGQSVDYHCPSGHGPESFTRMCQENGQFSPAIACEPRLCASLPQFIMSSLTSTAPMFFFGQHAEYSCSEGFSTDPTNPLASDFTLECLADGWETGVVGCLPVTCEFQPDETHAADVAYTMEYDGINTVSCADGHTTDGSAQGATELAATCSHDGVANVQSCRPVACSASSLQIAVDASVDDARDYTLGTRATYTCDQGYAVALTSAASFEVECLRSGSFSAMSTCRNIDDCAGHSCGSNGRCVDGIGDYSCACDDGFEETVADSGEKICGNIDDCGVSACGPNGACRDLTNGYECVCEDGYAVPESETSGDDRICLASVCQIPALEGVVATAPDVLLFPLTLYLECAEGLSLGDRVGFQVECTADGLKSDGSTDLPACSPVVCGQAPAVPHAQDLPQQEEGHDYTFGEVAQYTCQGGEVQVIYECQADGQFSITSEFRTCQNSCGSPLVPSHAQRLDGAGVVVHPTAALFACNEGFTYLASGMPAQELSQPCQASGVFEPIAGDVAVDGTGRPMCVPVVCQKPSAPPNWEWVDDSTFNTQTSAQLRCANGYQSNGQSGAASQFEITCDNDGAHSALPAACEAPSFTLAGRVRSALPPRSFIGGASLVIDGQTIPADSSGGLTVDLLAGAYEYTLSAGGYITTTGSITVTASTSDWHFHMSPELDLDQWRIVLTWGQLPEDLDAHFVFYDQSCDKMFWQNPRASCGSVTATLDYDHTGGLGPETTTLSNVNSCATCKWVYRVKNYAAHYNRVNGWTDSRAEVMLYNGDHVVDTFKVIDGDGFTNGDGKGYSATQFWSVFSIEGDGTVTQCTNEDCD